MDGPHIEGFFFLISVSLISSFCIYFGELSFSSDKFLWVIVESLFILAVLFEIALGCSLLDLKLHSILSSNVF